MNRCLLGLLLFTGPALTLGAELPKTALRPPRTSTAWDLMLLDPAPPGMGETDSTAVGDIDGDGRQEIVIGGGGALLWYRPATFAKGLVARGHFHCGVALLDVDGDGIPEIIAGREIETGGKGTRQWAIWWFKPGKDLDHPGVAHVIDPRTAGGPHDVIVADLDGDGKPEIVAAEHDPFKPYKSRCRLFVYKLADPKGTAWFRNMLDDRFEQHGGAKVVELAPGKFGILGHGWMESRYLHLWRPD